MSIRKGAYRESWCTIMQEIPKDNKNERLEKKGKHIIGHIVQPESLMDAPKLDKRGLSVADYR